jgi:hypothetical protein
MAESGVKRFPTVGACGLDCGLCPRHHTQGSSRCPGCAAETYAGPGCALQRCCVDKHRLECCAQCPEAEGCPKLDRVIQAAATGDSFISYLPVPENHRLIRELGIGEFARRQDERVAFLETLLRRYDDGRSKGFYCLAVQVLPLDQLQVVVDRLSPELARAAEAKDRAAALRAAFEELASQKGLTLKLRRPKKEAG